MKKTPEKRAPKTAAKQAVGLPSLVREPAACIGHAVPGRTYVAASDIIESKTNPRQHFDEVKLNELAESIRIHPLGIIEPIVVRRVKGGKVEIIAGARRFRAGKIAGLTSFPVDVVDLDDRTVVETQIIENLQREDPHPMEEAEGYARLISMGHSADEIAIKVGKDRSHIYRRLQFDNLVPEAKEAFRDGRLNIQLALQVARLPKEHQPEAFEQCFPYSWGRNGRVYHMDQQATATSRELSEFVARELTHQLKGAPFSTTDADLVPAAGACTTCPKRTGSNPTLFDATEELGKTDSCMDEMCFSAKVGAFVQLEITRAETAGTQLVELVDYGQDPAPGQRTPNQVARFFGKGKCKHAVQAITVAGRETGKKEFVCIDPKCPTHGAGNKLADKTTPGNKRANAVAAAKLRITTETHAGVLHAMPDAHVVDPASLLKFIMEWALDRAGDDGRRMLAKAWGTKPKDEPALVELAHRAATEKKGAQALAFLAAVASSSSYGGRYKKGAKLLGVNLGNIEKRITETIMAKVDKRYPTKAAKPTEKKKRGRPRKHPEAPVSNKKAARKGGAK